MTCTDEDLKVIKQSIQNTEEIFGVVGNKAATELKELVARLEAAERVIHFIEGNRETISIDEQVKLWRKAAGK